MHAKIAPLKIVVYLLSTSEIIMRSWQGVQEQYVNNLDTVKTLHVRLDTIIILITVTYK